MAQDAPFFAPGAYDADAEQIRRRMQLAQSLQQNQDPLQGQMVSGRYVRPSWVQGISNLLQTYAGKQMEDKSMQDLQDLSARRGQEQAKDLTGVLAALRGTPGTPGRPAVEAVQARPAQPEVPAVFPGQNGQPGPGYQPAMPAVEGVQGSPEVPEITAVPADPNKALALALASRSPMVQQFGQSLMTAQLHPVALGRSLVNPITRETIATDNAWKGEQEAARAARAQEQEAARQAHVEQQKQASADRENLVRLTASLRTPPPEPLVPVLTPGSTTPVLLPRSQAVGQQPWNPAAAKSQEASEKQAAGKQTVSDAVAELKNYYDVLKNKGGITSTENGAGTNLVAKIANTGIGQFGASVLGLQEQKARESISQARPLLMSAIKNATGMSSQQMNSNAELMFYMQAATDPSKGYEANMDAIKRLDKMFGLGTVAKELDGGKPGGAEGAWDNPQDAAAMEWAKANPADPRSKAIMQKLGVK